MRLENVVKQKLKNGEVVMGIFNPLPSPDVVEILALAGFDFVLLDAEHGRISPDDAYPMILAAEARDVPIFVRVGENDRQVILKYLDLGVSGVMIPQTSTPELVAEAVQRCAMPRKASADSPGDAPSTTGLDARCQN